MNKLDLMNKIFKDIEKISDDGAIKCVEGFFTGIVDGAKSHGKVSISKFGVFELKKNDSSYRFTFKSSKTLKDIIKG